MTIRTSDGIDILSPISIFNVLSRTEATSLFHVVAGKWQGVPATKADASLSHPQAGLAIIPSIHTHTGYTPMLIIPRSKNQAVVIGGDIIVNVVEVDGDRVELSIEYPDGTSVRAEKEVVERESAIEEPVAAI